MDQELKEVTLYTDGGCEPNPGPGGYGVVLLHGEHRRELSGGFRLTTNNRMEILAAIVGLEAIKHPCRVTIHSDSRYLVNAVSKHWLGRWEAKGWKRGPRERVKNVDLWKRLLPLLEKHHVTFKWVRGHTGVPENERCDELATKALQAHKLPPDEGYVRELEASVQDDPPAEPARPAWPAQPTLPFQSAAPAAPSEPRLTLRTAPPAGTPSRPVSPGVQAAGGPVIRIEVAIDSPGPRAGAVAPQPEAPRGLQIRAIRPPAGATPESHRTNSEVKITREGQPCRKCGTPVVRKVPSGKRKGPRLYTYAYYYWCPGCLTQYLVDEAKVPAR